jgi:hypothetical protein
MRRGTDLSEARREVGEQAQDLGRGWAEQGGKVASREPTERRTDGADDRPVRLIRPGGPGGGAQNGHRLAHRAHPLDRLVKEAAGPDARRAVEQDRPRPTVGGGIEPGREASE